MTVACPAIIYSKHGMGDGDIPFFTGLNENIVQGVPVFGSWMLLCCFVPVWVSEQSVGHSRVMSVYIAVVNTMVSKNSLLCTLALKSPRTMSLSDTGMVQIIESKRS